MAPKRKSRGKDAAAVPPTKAQARGNIAKKKGLGASKEMASTAKKVESGHHESDCSNEGRGGEKEIITDLVWTSYVNKIYPAKPLQGRLLNILSEELTNGFAYDPERIDVASDDFDNAPDNVQKFCKMCAVEDPDDAGLAWLNALHQFEEPDCDRKDDEDEEAFNARVEAERQYLGKFTPLTYVLENDADDFRTVGLLLGMGADANARDGRGEPALYKVLKNEGRWRTAHMLLESGASVWAFYGGKSVAGWAKELAKISERVKMIWEDIRKMPGVDRDYEQKQIERMIWGDNEDSFSEQSAHSSDDGGCS